MKASELIQELQKFISVHGDSDVVTTGGYTPRVYAEAAWKKSTKTGRYERAGAFALIQQLTESDDAEVEPLGTRIKGF